MSELGHGHHGDDENVRLYSALTSSALLIAGFLTKPLLGAQSEILHSIAFFIGLIPVAYYAYQGFKRNPFNIDVLMFLASVGAYYIGSDFEALLVLIVYNFAEFLEEKIEDRVKEDIKNLVESLPKKVNVKTNGDIKTISVENIKPGDIVVVRRGEFIPIDGEIISGGTYVDESNLTGESIPVFKSKGERVYSGSINIGNPIEVKVDRGYEDFFINRITRMVIEAKENKANIERLVDKFSKFYTPIILVFVALIIFVPTLFLGGNPNEWIYRGIVILVIACPSAFVLSVPITSMIGLVKGIRHGVLFKGSLFFEIASDAKIVAFDKTGTLTLGEINISNVIPYNGYNEEKILSIAASIEKFSSHPIAKAIVKTAEVRGLPAIQVREVKEHIGYGIEAKLEDGKEVLIGNLEFMKKRGVKINKETISSTDEKIRVYMSINNQLCGLILLSDSLKRNAKQAILELQKLNLKTIMLTGDKKDIAEKIAKELGITQILAELKPEEKLEKIRKMKKEGTVVMVGDGVNDAPALAEADVGIAISKIGNDIAVESADITIINENINNVPFTIKLSKAVKNKQMTNLMIALMLKGILLILGALGLIPLLIAVLGDDGVTLLLAANSMRLIKTKNL